MKITVTYGIISWKHDEDLSDSSCLSVDTSLIPSLATAAIPLSDSSTHSYDSLLCLSVESKVSIGTLTPDEYSWLFVVRSHDLDRGSGIARENVGGGGANFMDPPMPRVPNLVSAGALSRVERRMTMVGYIGYLMGTVVDEETLAF